MAIAGALIGGAIGAFGEKTIIPDLPPIDPSQIQAQTVAGNLGVLPQAEQLGVQINQFNTQQKLASLEARMPGFVAQARKNVGAQLRGEIPTDVNFAIQQAAAETGLNLGVAGGGIGTNLAARNLGLTSLGIQQQGLANFGALASLTGAPQFDITSMFFSPQQRLSFAMEDRAARFNRDLLANQIAAAPDPATAALGREIDRFFNTAAAAGMMAAGGGFGGVGGAAGAAGGGAAAGGGGGLPSTFGAFCWVAREVFGSSNPKWLLFRHWLLNKAPSWFRKLYIKHGQGFAEWISDKPRLKAIIRHWMERRINAKPY